MKALHVFDVDHTLLTCSISVRFFFQLCKEGTYSPFSFPKALYYALKYRNKSCCLHDVLFHHFLKGHSFQFLEEQADLLISQHLTRFLNQAIMERINTARQLGDHVGLLSTAPHFLVKRIAEKLDIDLVCGSQYQVDSSGCFSNIAEVMSGSKKQERLIEWQEKLAVQTTHAYSDHVRDLPFLMHADQACVVGGSRALLKYAKEYQWERV